MTLVYQSGRSLGEAMAALKAGMAVGLCGPAALRPLMTLDDIDQEGLRKELASLDLV